MPVQLSQSDLPINSEIIRSFLRDTPDFNILHDDVVFSNDDINNAIYLTMHKWNAITPISNINNPARVPPYVMLCGVCGFLLKSEGIRQMQNQMQVQDGNIAPAGLDEKESLYFRWATHFQQEFLQYASNIKIQENLQSILDPKIAGFGSGYRNIGRYSP
jgi:hypothetical protein